jgi:hypothetical protein
MMRTVAAGLTDRQRKKNNMKNKITIALTMLALGASALAVNAQDANPPQGGDNPNGPRGHHPPIPAIVLALDVNHDGVIDSNEIANASAELKTLDKNGDGQLTRDEYMGKRPGPPPDSEGNNAGSPPDGAPSGPPPQQ